MGAVYLAHDGVLGKEVALKVLNERFAGDVVRLRDEVLLAHQVTHRNVCRTYDLEEVDGNWLIKMEYIDGDTLAARVAAAGRLSISEACAIARQIAVGLAAAHERGVVHRDLKPQNIVIERDTGRVVLMDFGLARLSVLAGRSAEGVAGTPEYMAPEQARGRNVDGRADLYALGCVLYFMLTGQVVFPSKTPMAAALRHAEDPPPEPRAVRPDIPTWLAQLILRLLEKDPGRRPADAAQVVTALDGPARRWRRTAAVALLAAALGAIGLTLWLLLARAPAQWRPLVRGVAPTYEEDASWMVFSPDGKLVAYSSDRDDSGHARIYVDSLADGSSRMISPPGVTMWRPRWTRDGLAILATAQPMTAVYRLPVDGGAPEIVAQSAFAPEDCNGRVLFVRLGTPDCLLCSRIVLREADGRERDLVRFTARHAANSLRCDRAGERVVYTVIPHRLDDLVRRKRSDLWIAPLEGGSPRQLTFDGLSNDCGAFHPDGKSIVFSSDRTGEHKLWEMSVDGGPPVQLTFGAGDDLCPDLSPDGRTIGYQLEFNSSMLVAYSLPGGVRRKLTSRYQVLNELQMTPDGDEIVATAARGQDVFIVAIDTRLGAERTLARGRTPAVSPDGREIFYSLYGTPTRVLAVPRTGGTPRPVTELSQPIRHLAAGADGQLHIWVVGEKGFEAWRAPLAGGVAEREAPAAWAWIVPAPARGWRMAVAIEGIPLLEGVRVTRHFWPPGASFDDPPASVQRSDGPGWGVWDASGQSLVHVAGSKVGRFFPASSEEVVLFDTGAEIPLGSVAVSPDGNTVYLPEHVGHSRRSFITNFGDRPRPR
jgi:Tol biopolymer transport system component